MSACRIYFCCTAMEADISLVQRKYTFPRSPTLRGRGIGNRTIRTITRSPVPKVPTYTITSVPVEHQWRTSGNNEKCHCQGQWSSPAPSVVTVNSTGVATAVGSRIMSITATLNRGPLRREVFPSDENRRSPNSSVSAAAFSIS